MPIVFVPMCADMFHIGHVNILKTAASYGSVTVLLMTDVAMIEYKRKPLITYDHRKTILLANTYVHDVVPCHGPGSYEHEVRKHRPDFFVHGDDWQQGVQSHSRKLVLDAMKEYNGQVIEPPYTQGCSTSDNLTKIDTETMQKYGVLLRAAMNDLKRTVSVVSKETGVDVDVLESVIHGSYTQTTDIEEIIAILTKVYPIHPRQMMMTEDSSRGDMWYMSKKMSEASARIIDRTNTSGKTVPYYRYMDTATSALAPFQPELIEILVGVHDNDPMNPSVVMNKGHLLAQQTFFIGPVNIYTVVQGVRYCRPMRTGDSCLITPYVPHSFAKREENSYAAIVAVTFSTSVREVLPDLVHFDTKKLLSHAGDSRQREETRQKRIARYAELRGLTYEEVITKVQQRNPLTNDAENENAFLSTLLNVPPSTFDICSIEPGNEVTYAVRKDEKVEKSALASALHIADSGGYVWHFSEERDFESGFFSYIFNYGVAPVFLKDECIAPGDSIVMKPFTYARLIPHGNVKIVVMHVGSWVSSQLLNEISTFAVDGQKLMTSNVCRWW